jgi:isopentenyl phosphate kinase
MRRALPMLRKINQHHLLVVVFFENTDLQEHAFQPMENTSDVYISAVAERMITLKSRMATELKQNGIQTILTTPSELSIQTVNKYLELKAKGAI